MKQQIITEIHKDERNRKNLIIYIDDMPGPSVHEDIWLRYRLTKGTILTEDLLTEIEQAAAQYDTYVLAIRYLGRKACSRKQLQNYLVRKQSPETAITYTLDRLTEEKLLNDEEFARQFAESKLKHGKKGRNFIVQQLQSIGISQKIAQAAVSTLDENNEYNTALYAAEKKWPQINGEYRQKKFKLQQFLLRRGFPAEMVYEIIKMEQFCSIEEELLEEDGHMLDN